MKKAKERIIYDNYDLDPLFEGQREIMREDDSDVSDDTVWACVYDIDHEYFNDAIDELKKFFSTEDHVPYRATFIIFGSVGRWDGTSTGFDTFRGEDFASAFDKATKDCDYIKVWDENGHLYMEGTHHDGTNCYEIKRLTERGEIYLENWDYAINDKRSSRYVLDQLVRHYSTLPRFAEKVYGVPRVEWEKKEAK